MPAHFVISVVMPAHNEQVALPVIVRRVMTTLAPWPHEIIVIDDGSTDGTWEEIRALHEVHPQVRGIRLTRNFGHQAALVAGLRAAKGAAVIMMDADGQHPAELLPEFVRLWRRGHTLVQGIRITAAEERWLKRLTSRAFYRMWSLLSGVPIVRGSADFRLIDRAALDAVLASAGSLVFLRGLIAWLGYEVRYIPFTAAARLGGCSSYTWLRMLQLSIDGLTAYSIVPLRIAMALGLSISGLSLAYLCFVLGAWLGSMRVVSGWASTAGLMSLVGGIQLFTVGVLGEYVGRIFLRTLDRPQFVVADEVGTSLGYRRRTGGAT